MWTSPGVESTPKTVLPDEDLIILLHVESLVSEPARKRHPERALPTCKPHSAADDSTTKGNDPAEIPGPLRPELGEVVHPVAGSAEAEAGNGREAVGEGLGHVLDPGPLALEGQAHSQPARPCLQEPSRCAPCAGVPDDVRGACGWPRSGRPAGPSPACLYSPLQPVRARSRTARAFGTASGGRNRGSWRPGSCCRHTLSGRGRCGDAPTLRGREARREPPDPSL